jgi:hypothetical protein
MHLMVARTLPTGKKFKRRWWKDSPSTQEQSRSIQAPFIMKSTFKQAFSVSFGSEGVRAVNSNQESGDAVK